MFNPFTLLTYLGRPTVVFTNTAIICAVSYAVRRKPLSACVALAFATYLSMYPILLLPPLVMLNLQGQGQARWPAVLKQNLTFVLGLAWLLILSYFLAGQSWEFVPSTYGVQLLVSDLTPNVGLWWYFFIEMFDSFRSFFIGVFWLHLASFVAGLCIRIHRQPLFVITSMLGIFAIFKPYPSVADSSLYLAMLALYRHVLPCKLNPPY